MLLTAEQIRMIATGVLDVEEESNGIRLHRTTAAQKNVYSKGEDGWIRAQSAASITLDFLSNTENVLLVCSDILLVSNYHCTFDVFVDGVLYNSFSLMPEQRENVAVQKLTFRHSIRLPVGEKRVTIYFPLYAFRLNGIEIDSGATLFPYKHKRRWVAFGDSITEGREPDHPCNSYVNRLARMLDAAVFNQGISGEMFRSNKLVPGTYPQCDFVTVAYGTNDFRKQAKELLIPEASAFFTQVVSEFPDVPIFYLLPLWRLDKDRVTCGYTLEEVRELLRKEAEKFSQIIVIDCWDFIPHDVNYFFDQRLHPNDKGFAIYAEKLCRALKKYLA